MKLLKLTEDQFTDTKGGLPLLNTTSVFYLNESIMCAIIRVNAFGEELSIAEFIL